MFGANPKLRENGLSIERFIALESHIMGRLQPYAAWSGTCKDDTYEITVRLELVAKVCSVEWHV